MAAIPVNHVYIGMFNVLEKLAVAKTAELPGNMGGKPYIEAHVLAMEVKKLFVAEKLMVLPYQTMTKHEVVVREGRAPHIAVAMEAMYTIVSTVDGTQAHIQGVGDGLASGTAVASIIAGTNAMKNALMATFMVSEQSAEQAAKEGPVDTDTKPESRAVATAKNGATQASRKDAANAVVELQGQVKQAWAHHHGEDDDGYLALAAKMYGDDAATWATNQTKLKGLVKAIEAGEVA
jgi:hypothetical protein